MLQTAQQSRTGGRKATNRPEMQFLETGDEGILW
jgi:hypothetical protein